LAQAWQRLEQAQARIKQLEGQAGKDSHNSSKPPPATGSSSRCAKRRACEKRVAKRVEASPAIEATP
jgi:hypothetical protein